MRRSNWKSLFSQKFKSTASSKQLTKDEIRDLLNIEPERKLPATQPKEERKSVFDVQPSLYHDIVDFYEQNKDIKALNERFNTQIKEMRYGLPLPNIDPGFKNLDAMYLELNPPDNTPLQNLYLALDLNKNSSFEEYQKALQSKYNFAALFGEEEFTPTEQEKISFLSVPQVKLDDGKYMKWLRTTSTVNPNIPGCMEVEDVNRFIPDLRPVDDFPHTPIIPISPQQMKIFNDSRKRRKEKKFFFEITTEKFLSLGMFMATGMAIVLLIRFAMKKEEEMLTRYQKKKLIRIEQANRNTF